MITITIAPLVIALLICIPIAVLVTFGWRYAYKRGHTDAAVYIRFGGKAVTTLVWIVAWIAAFTI